MPLYDYECQDCRCIVEFLRPYSNNTIYETCSKCHGKFYERSNSLFKRVFNPTSTFVLGGGGWAKDNYNKSEKKKDKD